MNVQVILNEDLPNLGRTGDVVKVRAGYARNYLLPRKLAVEADQKNLRAFEHQKRIATRRREAKRTDALAVKAKIEALALTLNARAGEEGKLFGSVTNIDHRARAARERSRYRAAQNSPARANQAARRVHGAGQARFRG